MNNIDEKKKAAIEAEIAKYPKAQDLDVFCQPIDWYDRALHDRDEAKY